MIDCHVIFNAESDREDWLERCIESLLHDSVNVHVHRFEKSDGTSRQRRSKILAEHSSSNWITFADPDDYTIQPGYNQYIEFLEETNENVAWCSEYVVYPENPSGNIISSRPHHLVALRGIYVTPYPETRHYFSNAIDAGVHFPKVAYCWVRHQGATYGNFRDNRPI